MVSVSSTNSCSGLPPPRPPPAAEMQRCSRSRTAGAGAQAWMRTYGGCRLAAAAGACGSRRSPAGWYRAEQAAGGRWRAGRSSKLTVSCQPAAAEAAARTIRKARTHACAAWMPAGLDGEAGVCWGAAPRIGRHCGLGVRGAAAAAAAAGRSGVGGPGAGCGAGSSHLK